MYTSCSGRRPRNRDVSECAATASVDRTYRRIEELYDENDLMVALALLYVDDWFLQHLFPIIVTNILFSSSALL